MRRKYCEHEQDLLQKLKYENKKLKRQLGSARKELVKVQQWRENAKEILESQYKEDLDQKIQENRSQFWGIWINHCNRSSTSLGLSTSPAGGY